MRILYITDALAVWGGIERVLCDKTTSLVKHYGYEVHIVTTDQGDHPIPYTFDNRVNVHDLDIRYHRQYRFHGLNRLLEFWKLNRLFLKRLKESIVEIKPDIIVCIRIESVETILKAKGNIPLICESHSLCYAYKYEKTSFLYRLRYKRSLRQMHRVDCVVALTEGDANDWRNYNSNVVVIPNVVHLNYSGKYSDFNKKMVIFVGRFTAQKDVWSLLEIWKMVHSRHPDWELRVFGEGELKKDFEGAVQRENTNIKVFPPTTHIFDKYLESSMLLMTSLYEPFGLVIPEAMSCGLPVVAFDCPYGPKDIIVHDYNGYLIENRDCRLFADYVCRLIESPQSLFQMSKHAIASVHCYCDEILISRWKSLFEQIIILNKNI